mmetsp:Transcript_61697/g.125252  ORF Transcript_61697/g.125252 Transcript_61697/m.125252 type:complete len:258 (-) Transcript_61697:409-1182(-)
MQRCQVLLLLSDDDTIFLAAVATDLCSQGLVVPAHQLIWHLLAIQCVVSCLLPNGGLLLGDLHRLQTAVLLVLVVEGHPFVLWNLMQRSGAHHRIKVELFVLLVVPEIIDQRLPHGPIHHNGPSSLSGFGRMAPLDVHLLAINQIDPFGHLLHAPQPGHVGILAEHIEDVLMNEILLVSHLSRHRGVASPRQRRQRGGRRRSRRRGRWRGRRGGVTDHGAGSSFGGTCRTLRIWKSQARGRHTGPSCGDWPRIAQGR